MRQKGFACRQQFDEFVERYKWCVNKQIRNKLFNNCTNFKQLCGIILDELKDKLNGKDIQIGETMIFYRETKLVILENIRDENLKIIFMSTQKLIRGAIARRQLNILKIIKTNLSDGLVRKNKKQIQKGLHLFYEWDKKEINLARMDEIDKAEQFMKYENGNIEIVNDDSKEIDVIDEINSCEEYKMNESEENNLDSKSIIYSKDIEILNDNTFENYNSNLCIPQMKEFDSNEIDIVDTIDNEIIKSLEINNCDLNVLIKEETKVFNKLRNEINGTWTQRFVVKRMKIKFVNILFKRRVRVLKEFTRNDCLNTNKLLVSYNGLSVYTFYHETKMRKMIKILLLNLLIIIWKIVMILMENIQGFYVHYQIHFHWIWIVIIIIVMKIIIMN